MAFSPVWLFFACLSVVGSLAYNIGVKIGGSHINGFLFTLTLTAVAFVGHSLALLCYRQFGENVVFQFDRIGVQAAILAGIGVTIIDLAFFFATKNGTLVASHGFWVVGGMLVTLVFSLLVFKEPINGYKISGICLGLISLYLISR